MSVRSLQTWFDRCGWPPPGQSINVLQALHIVWECETNMRTAKETAAELGYRSGSTLSERVYVAFGMRLRQSLDAGGFPLLTNRFARERLKAQRV